MDRNGISFNVVATQQACIAIRSPNARATLAARMIEHAHRWNRWALARIRRRESAKARRVYNTDSRAIAQLQQQVASLKTIAAQAI